MVDLLYHSIANYLVNHKHYPKSLMDDISPEEAKHMVKVRVCTVGSPMKKYPIANSDVTNIEPKININSIILNKYPKGRPNRAGNQTFYLLTKMFMFAHKL